jgi:hypothetical protein
MVKNASIVRRLKNKVEKVDQNRIKVVFPEVAVQHTIREQKHSLWDNPVTQPKIIKIQTPSDVE